VAKINRILLTGAAGALGTILRPGLDKLAHNVRLNDIKPISEAATHEEIVDCDLTDMAAVQKLTRDVDMVVHMGGAGREMAFIDVMKGNIHGFYNLYEACRQNKVRRVIWGSSNHAVGMHSRTALLDDKVSMRPDSNYGASKAFGEALAQMYWDKFNVESISIRIGSCFSKPVDRRMLSTWFSYPDLVHMIERCVIAPRVEHTIIYGVSKNDTCLWDNRHASHLGFLPKSNAEDFRAEVEAATPPYDVHDLTIAVHGGGFAAMGHFDDFEKRRLEPKA
jgi:uronate dehydrogenase